ncbi:olfactory receptor 4S1-like [Conger conger]|uniref:olfactory receptor 4S1-like n=1 Tax=Conger conger TaxID=82655 RepID=UPI002A59C24D|nr:olfactory receptor 4S1-like [Conger conger]
MNHSPLDITIIFTSYGSFRPLNYFFFTLTFIFYLLSVLSNILLMLVIYFESSLHKPMYIFLFNLAVNGLIGSSAIWPKVMENLLSDTQKSSLLACLVQVFWSYFYISSAYTTFSVMAYDRYISICKPLLYHSIMTPRKVKALLTAANIIPLSSISIQVYLTSTLPMCGYTIHNLFCDNLELLKLSCVKSALVSLYGVCMITILIGFPCIIVLLSYAKILTVSLKASKDARKKALSTCSPHLITFINLSLASLFVDIYHRYSSVLPGNACIVMIIDIFVIPPLLHPIIYGIRTQEIRKCFVKTVRKKERFFRIYSAFSLTMKFRLRSGPINVLFNDKIN